MRPFLSLLLIMICSLAAAQDTPDTNVYAFPVGCRFTLKMVPADSNHFRYDVLFLEQIDYSIDYSDYKTVFLEHPVPETIEGIFAPGTDQKGPFKTVLVLKNNTNIPLDYSAEIAYDDSGYFSNTSVSPLFPCVPSSELWNNNLAAIVVHKFRKMK